MLLFTVYLRMKEIVFYTIGYNQYPGIIKLCPDLKDFLTELDTQLRDYYSLQQCYVIHRKMVQLKQTLSTT